MPGSTPADVAVADLAMRIVYLHQYFVTPGMGGATRSYEMARRLVRAGHEVHVVTSDQRGAGSGWRETDEAGIRVHWIPVPYDNRMSYARRLKSFFEFAARAASRAAALRGDVIFATSTPLTIALPAIYAGWRTRRPYVFEVRDLWPDVPIALGAIRGRLPVAAARLLEHMAYRLATHVVALAPGMRDDIVRKGIDPKKVSVIPNGCDVDVFGARPAQAGSADESPRTRFPWLGDRPLVLYAGAVGAVNGVSYLVDVAAAAARLDPDVRFVIMGQGREWDLVEQAAEQAGVLNRSLFMLRHVPKPELAAWVAAADFTVALITGPRVVWKDAVQNKFFDGLAAGRPVASNFVGWQSQIAAEEGVGITLDPTDPTGAAKHLLRTMADDAWMARARARAAELAAGRFSRDRLAEALERLLRSVQSDSTPRAEQAHLPT